jgi:hypothetical protein
MGLKMALLARERAAPMSTMSWRIQTMGTVVFVGFSNLSNIIDPSYLLSSADLATEMQYNLILDV